MAKTTNRLTAVGIKNLKEKGLHADGGGLYLRITDSGTKGWIFRFARDARTRDMGLGAYADISLASAREIAEQCRKLLKQGADPIESAPGQAGRRQEVQVLYGVRPSQPPRPRVMREVLAARPAAKRSQGRPQAGY